MRGDAQKKKVKRIDRLNKVRSKGFMPKPGDVVKWNGPCGIEVRIVLFVRDGFAWFSRIHSMPCNRLRPAEEGDPMPPENR